jgi:CDP-diacylglycerol--serine O-phosphatidyltransferase
MEKRTFLWTIKAGVPNALTSLRVLLGAFALFAAVFQRLDLSATLVIVSLITDYMDGVLARKFGAASYFGAAFDYYADYLTYVVVPSVLSLMLVGDLKSAFGYLALSMPLLTGAVRYARNFGLSRQEDFETEGFPGLATLFYAFYVIAMVFLARENAIGNPLMGQLLIVGVPIFSLLMLAPIRYPKLVVYKPILVFVVVGLNLMPFILTTVLAVLTLALILIYTLFSPLVISQRKRHSRTSTKSVKQEDKGFC